MAFLLERDKHTAVEQDWLPRVARYREDDDSESIKVLYWNVQESIVRTLTDVEWLAEHAMLPTAPTAQQIAAAIAAREAATAADLAAIAALRQQIVNLAQSAVGVRVDLLTAGQRNAIVACLAWRAGAIANDMTVLPLGQWLK